MIDELISIDDYKELKIIKSNEIFNFVIILLAVLSFLLLILFNFSFECYYKNSAIYNDNELSLVVKVEDLSYILDNSIIVINDKNYKYKVKKLEPIMINGSNYTQNVIINIYGFESANNNVIELKILYDTKTGFKIIKDFILGKGV